MVSGDISKSNGGMMKELILSEENYDYGIDIEFKPSKNGLYQYRNWLTDGWMLLDTDKIHKGVILGTKELTKGMYDSAIAPFINKEYLKTVLNKKNRVRFSAISYNGLTLAEIGNKKYRVLDSFMAEQIASLECFFKDDKYFFFAFNEAEEEAGIDFDSYMFLGLVMGMKHNKITQNNIKILSKLETYLSCMGEY